MMEVSIKTGEDKTAQSLDRAQAAAAPTGHGATVHFCTPDGYQLQILGFARQSMPDIDLGSISIIMRTSPGWA
jgi:hypothetical protein